MSRNGAYSLQQTSALFRELPWLTGDLNSKELIETDIVTATGASVSISSVRLGNADVPSFLSLSPGRNFSQLFIKVKKHFYQPTTQNLPSSDSSYGVVNC